MRFSLSIVYSSLLLAFFGLSMMSNSSSPSAYYQNSPASQKAKSYLLEQLYHLQQQLQQLAQSLSTKKDTAIQRDYLAARTTFKQIEGLIAYLDPQLYERQLNESPLLKPTPHVANKEVHHPQGWQPLEETLFIEDIDYPQAHHLLQQLQRDLKEFETRSTTFLFYDALVLHAIKEQLLRSFMLGITGFDTPASDHALEDFKAVHQGIAQLLQCYQGRFPETSLQAIFTLIKQINYNSFEDFDRYGYLVGQLIPLLEHLEDIRQQVGIESKEELQQLPLPIKSTFTNPFQKDFLNASYYTQLIPSEVTPDRVALGKRLFNDPILSQNLKTSCATCHRDKQAFTDGLKQSFNQDRSAQGTRNAPSLNYAVYASSYFYDLRAHDLSNVFEHVIHDDKEFATDYPSILQRLSQDSLYTNWFQQHYPTYPQPISTASLNHALKCYLMSLPTFDSAFDRYVQEKKTTIPVAIQIGFNLFMGKAQCATCHFPPTFSGLVPPSFKESESEVLGVLEDEDYNNPTLDQDKGRQASGVVKDNFPFYQHAFKTMSVRNSAMTAPYMHNGAFNSLDTLLEFYNRGGGQGLGLELKHQTLPAEPLHLSTHEKAALVAFLQALTDANY